MSPRRSSRASAADDSLPDIGESLRQLQQQTQATLSAITDVSGQAQLWAHRTAQSRPVLAVGAALLGGFVLGVATPPRIRGALFTLAGRWALRALQDGASPGEPAEA